MSFHPSALRPRVQGNNHYANFIVLPDPDNEIADQRYRYIKGTTGTSGLRELFQEIQVFMKQNNCMMDAFKNMLTLEKEAAANQIDPGSLKFRTVSPHEVDDSFFKKVGSHKGVYAVKSRMGTGYVSVAYSFEPNSSIALPRGLTIYPKNPKGKTMPGTSKYQRELMMSAISISNKLGHPDLFITFTGNPKWPEIEKECEKLNCNWADIPEFVNEVFSKKAKMFLDDVCGTKVKSSKDHGRYIRQPRIFGKSLEDHITTAAHIDKIVRAEVPPMPSTRDPNYAKKLRYRQLVQSLMTHLPCEHDPETYCNESKKPHWKRCKKGFPKQFSEETTITDNAYPNYKRTKENKFVFYRKNKRFEAGSEYVVSHNPYLLQKYGCHLNVEVVSSSKTVKYMFKYIHKGSDRVLLEATETFGKSGKALEGTSAMTLQGTIIAPPDVVHRGYIHEENNEMLYFKRGLSAEQADELLGKKSQTMQQLAQWICDEK